MRRFTPILILPLLMTFLSISPAVAGWWGDDTLVTIDGTRHTTEDFKRWWGFYNDSNMTLPKTPDIYIDWLLLAREGKRMKLDEDPSFRHKTEVFLKVRSLLMLQQEEVNGKIKITDAALRKRYEKMYTPMWLLERLQFPDEKSAQTARQQLMDGTVTLDELIKRPADQGGPTVSREDWRRPVGIDPGWADLFRKLDVGETTKPRKDLGVYSFYYLKKKEDGSDADFAKVRSTIKDALWSEQAGSLTAALIFRLREKFNVRVDEKRLADLKLDLPADSYGDEPIITTNHGDVSEKRFMAILRQDQQLRKPGEHEKIDVDQVKNRVLNGIIQQNITDWEALDRHYEKREPFKWAYQFNIKHRLTTAVQNRLFAPELTVSEQEIKDYYAKNISSYTQPEMVNLVLLQDKDGDVDRVWREVATGKDFFKTAKEETKQPVTAQPMPYPHLDPKVQKIIDGLAKGETSRPFTMLDQRFLVHLVSRTPAQPVPFEKVSQNIRTTLFQQKVAEQRKKYLDLLKSKSEIKVNESNWQEVQKELGGNK